MKKLILAIVIGLYVTTPAHANDVFERVLSTKTLRCGYAPWPALIDIDPNTGKISGTFYDYLNELGQSMGLKITWEAELGFGDIIEALNSDKVDAICSGAWTNARRGQAALAITPISYQGVNAYAHIDDQRFDGNLDLINKANVKIVTIDGESSQSIAKSDFPMAQTVELPQLTSAGEMLVNIATKKADIAFVDRHVAAEYMRNNPNKIKQVDGEFPLRLFGNPIWIKQGEFNLQNALNVATQQLIHTGRIEKILQKHETYPGTFYRPTKGFSLSKN